MFTPGMSISHSLLLALVLVASSQVHANFFSRLLKLPTDKDAPPSGAAAAMGSEAKVGSVVTFEDGMLMAHLSNNNKIPLVGVGVGNSPHNHVASLVAEAIQSDKKTRLIDTSHASHNEDLVAGGILSGRERVEDVDGKMEVHVVTKVWYTHLGYERTKLAVQESLADFKPLFESDKVDLKLHVLLHWPRCFDNVPWMDCDKEERDLPAYVKNAGPDPAKDPDNAWKESWRLLEDMYLSDKYPISSIGVSNFHLHDLEKMDTFARIHPHILQVNLWSLLYDAMLIEYCHKRRIHVQAYNAIQGTVIQPGTAPRAYHHIQKVANEMRDSEKITVTPAQVILAWLVQHGVSVIPKTSLLSRLSENSAVSLANVPAMDDMQVETVAHAVEAYLSGSDLEQDIHVSVTFHAVSKDIMLYWRDRDGGEVRIAHVKQGETFNETTYPNHVFRTYDASNKDVFIDHEISANFGDHESIHVEL
jgi:diketogulonate reductase-like aldo/keto reductase